MGLKSKIKNCFGSHHSYEGGKRVHHNYHYERGKRVHHNYHYERGKRVYNHNGSDHNSSHTTENHTITFFKHEGQLGRVPIASFNVTAKR